MRALAHYWSVTRQDNLAAQVLLEQAIAIDPHYGQALGLLALSYVFGTHMGWRNPAEIVRMPNAPRWRRSVPTAKMPGRILRLPPST